MCKRNAKDRRILILAISPLLALIACRPANDTSERLDSDQVRSGTVTTPADWPMFRGSAGLIGAIEGDFSRRPMPAWTAHFKDAISSQPVIADGTVYVTSERGVVGAFDLETGEEKWRFGGSFGFTATPLVHRDRLYLGDIDGIFYALDTATGEPVWTFQVDDKIEGAANLARVDAGTTDERELVVFGSYDSHLYALDAMTGEEVWRYQTENYINGSPALSDEGQIAFGGCDSFVHVVEARSGQSIHRLEGLTYIPGSVPVDQGMAYPGNHEGQLLALPLDGAPPHWTFSKPNKPFTAASAITEHTVYAANQNGRIYALDRKTGELRWQYTGESSFDASPVVVGDTVIAISYGGMVYALRAETGEPQWQYDLGGRVSGSPAIAGQHLLVGDDSGLLTVLAFDQ